MHRYLIVVASVLALAATTSSALAAWGCGARGPNDSFGYSYNYSTRAEASATALRLCANPGCSIIGCGNSVDTSEAARALWHPTAPITRCTGAGC